MSNYTDNSLNLEIKNTSWAKIFDLVPDNSKVLDIGCSSGHLGSELKKRKNCVVHGTEIDKKDSEIAKKNLDAAFFTNVESDPIPDLIAKSKYDIIILADVIEHLVNPAATLQKIKPLLADKGRLIFSIPNMAHVSIRLQLLEGDFSYTETGLLDKTHLHFYDFTEVKRVFAEAGYKINHQDSNTLTYPSSFLKKKLSDLGLADKGFIDKMVKDRQAQTFQFVGYATALGKSEKAGSVGLKASTPEHELTEYIEGLNSSVKQLRADLQQKETELENLKAQSQQELHNIHSSKTWKIGKAVTLPAKVISKRRKNKPKT